MGQALHKLVLQVLAGPHPLNSAEGLGQAEVLRRMGVALCEDQLCRVQLRWQERLIQSYWTHNWSRDDLSWIQFPLSPDVA